MSILNPLKLLGTIDGLLIPIQKAISAVLPDFIEDDLRNPAVRKQIVIAADKLLVKSHPEARLIPKATRHRIIGKSLDIVLDEIVLTDPIKVTV